MPGTCKALVTSRRRSDINARAIRLDRLDRPAALALLEELARSNQRLARASAAERDELYSATQGYPLLMRWVAGQLGRTGSHCHTVADACRFLESAPADNDPLEYIFGDLLGVLSAAETAALAMLVHFGQPVAVEVVAELAGLAPNAALTALEDLRDRALLEADAESQVFFLPPLTATFLRRKQPDSVALSGSRLADYVYKLVQDNGYQQFDRFPVLEAAWPAIAAALPIFVQGDNARLQKVCDGLDRFLDFSGRWDKWLDLSVRAGRGGYGHRQIPRRWLEGLLGRLGTLSTWAGRPGVVRRRVAPLDQWRQGSAGAREPGYSYSVAWTRDISLKQDYSAASIAYQQALDLLWSLDPTSAGRYYKHSTLWAVLNKLLGITRAAERDYRVALRRPRS